LKVEGSYEDAARQEMQALETYDNFCWLLSEIRQVLEPLTACNRIQVPRQAQDTLLTAIELLATLPDEKLTAFTQKLHSHQEELLAPLLWLHQTLAPWRKHLPPELEAWIVASRENDLDRQEHIPPHWRKTAGAIWDALALFHRSSSMAESLHSWLRPYLSIRRGIPGWLLPLLQLFWNHHVFARGKRAGQSPMQLAGVEAAPSLAAVFENLLANPSPA